MGSSRKVDTLSNAVDGPRLNTELYDLIAEKKGLVTKTAQAEYHGVWRGYWSEMYDGLRSPSFKFARKVARQFGVSTDALWVGPQ